jgi:hypothetical protein
MAATDKRQLTEDQIAELKEVSAWRRPRVVRIEHGA